MNDPHVVALVYRIEHGPGVSYDRAEPLSHQAFGFTILIQGLSARFEPTDHYATEEQARAAVEPIVRSWELDAGLK